MSGAATTTRWARRSVAVGIGSLVAWQATALVAGPGDPALLLALLGFVSHVVFGKAYALVPSYFARSLSPPWAPAVQLSLTVPGVALLFVDALGVVPPAAGAVGAALWAAGVVAFLAALAWTVRDNPTGAETGTGESEASRRRLDRYANAFVPVALAYVGVGSYQVLAVETGLPRVAGPGLASVAHLLGAGGAVLLVFAVGARLLPRLLVASPPAPLALAAPPLGAVGPLLVATSLGGGPGLVAGAAAEAAAVLAFGIAVLVLFVRSDRRRVGFYGVVAGAVAGGVAVALGVTFALDGRPPAMIVAHRRLNLLGFLGLTIVGLVDQFYPPTVAEASWADDRTAGAALVALGGGLAVEVVGLAAGVDLAVLAGRGLALAGAAAQLSLLLATFRARPVR